MLISRGHETIVGKRILHRHRRRPHHTSRKQSNVSKTMGCSRPHWQHIDESGRRLHITMVMKTIAKIRKDHRCRTAERAALISWLQGKAERPVHNASIDVQERSPAERARWVRRPIIRPLLSINHRNGQLFRLAGDGSDDRGRETEEEAEYI